MLNGIRSRKIKTIGISGNTIAALNAANKLSRDFEITVFQNATTFIPRTRGTVVPLKIAQQHNLPFLKSSHRMILQRCDALPGNERLIFAQNYQTAFCNTLDVYASLKNIGTSFKTIHSDITHIHPTPNSCRIQTSNQQEMEFDFFIAASALPNRVQNQLFPNVTIEPGSIATWSGTVDVLSEEHSKYANRILYYMMKSGYAILHFIPTENFHQTGNTVLHWVLHEKRDDWDVIMENIHNTNHAFMAKHDFSRELIIELKNQCFNDLPIYVAQLLINSNTMTVQRNHSFVAPTVLHQNLALIGEAAMRTSSYTSSFVQRELISSDRFCQTLLAKKEDIHYWNQHTVKENQLRQSTENRFINEAIFKPNYWDTMRKSFPVEGFEKLTLNQTHKTKPPITPEYHRSIHTLQNSRSKMPVSPNSAANKLK